MNSKSTTIPWLGHGYPGPWGRRSGPSSERGDCQKLVQDTDKVFRLKIDGNDKTRNGDIGVKDAEGLQSHIDDDDNATDADIDVGEHGEAPEADEGEAKGDLAERN